MAIFINIYITPNIMLYLKCFIQYVLYITYENSFLLESYEFTNDKNNSLFIVQKNTSTYLDGIRLAQSEKKEKTL